MKIKGKILIVDDELDVVMLLKDYFEINGYQVLTAHNGKAALAEISHQPELIILDINMPDMDGYEVCMKIRERIACPIIFLSARVEDRDKIKGFSVGGDDYVMKPFSMEELGARVQAHLRREKRRSKEFQVLFAGDLAIDYVSKEITCSDEVLSFTKKEFEIIELLSTHKGQVFDKERIYEKLWGWDCEGDSAVIGEHIRRIRNKLLAVSAEPYIETVWGMGYKWIK